MNHKPYVVTAGPSAGKTSTIRELSARGYRTAPEGARIVIDQLVSEGYDAKEFREENPQAYQQKVIKADKRVEENLPDDGIIFMDRSLADNMAYTRLTEREVPDELWQECENKYQMVFRLDRLDFSEDYARTEDEDMAQKVHHELGQVYNELGYNVIDVPVMPVDERADFIERKINRVPIH